MKNLYLAIATATIAFSASAVTLDREARTGTPKKSETVNFGTREFNYSMMREISQGETAGSKMLTARKADGNDTSIEGTWTFQMGDYYFNDSKGRMTLDFVATVSDGFVWFNYADNSSGATPSYLPFEAPYEEGDTELIFGQYLSLAATMNDGSRIFVYQEPYKYNWDTSELEEVDLVGTYNPEEGTLTFPADCGLAWAMYSTATPDPENGQGYFDIFDFEGAYIKTSDDSGWKNIGEALFMDGWVLPGFGIDQMLEENKWYVPLQQHKINEFLFRLVDPYHTGPFDVEALGEDAIPNSVQGKVGYIQFDISDAKHVIFDKVDAAFGGGSGMNRFNKFYCYNMLRNFMNQQNVSMADAIYQFELIPDFYPFTVFEDNTVKLTYTVRKDGGDICYDANFGIANNYDGELAKGGLGCTTADGKPANMCASIQFPSDYIYTGVGSVLEDNGSADENAPVEYYNLQGIRVSHPEAGQLLIRRQGNKSEKIIY